MRGRGHLPSGAGVLPSPHPPVVTDYPSPAQVRSSYPRLTHLWLLPGARVIPRIEYILENKSTSEIAVCDLSGDVVEYIQYDKLDLFVAHC